MYVINYSLTYEFTFYFNNCKFSELLLRRNNWIFFVKRKSFKVLRRYMRKVKQRFPGAALNFHPTTARLWFVSCLCFGRFLNLARQTLQICLSSDKIAEKSANKIVENNCLLCVSRENKIILNVYL